jgi:lysophospholipase L1-like esterase
LTGRASQTLLSLGGLALAATAGLGCTGSPPVEAHPKVPAVADHVATVASDGGVPGAAEPAVADISPALTVPNHQLDPFFEALARAEISDPAGRAAIVVFGDSHTAGDHLTGKLRRDLGARFGDAGRGFVLAGRPPIRHYYQRDVRYGSDGKWAAELGGKRDATGPFGLAGVRAHAVKKDATAWVESCEQCGSDRVARFDVFYLRRKDSGALAYRLDDGPWQKLVTKLEASAIEERTPAVLSVPATGERHRISLRPAGGGTIDLFGVALERGTPGVVVDALGVVGRRLGHLRSWDWDVIGPQLAARSPALVVLQYGTNEADDPELDLAAVARNHDEVIALIRQHAPGAAILVLGPPDMGERPGGKACDKLPPPPPVDMYGDGGVPLECQWHTPALLAQVIEVQRAAAARNGVAFFDSLTAMGGAEQMDVFFHMDPPLAYSDHVHFTQPGYELWGQRLLESLMTDYEAWKTRTTVAAPGRSK